MAGVTGAKLASKQVVERVFKMGSQKAQKSSWRKITVRFYRFEFDRAIQKGPKPEDSLEAMY
jgi:hypothetical protein